MSNKLTVYYESRVVGVISIDDKTQSFDFSYDHDWVDDGFEISPHIKFNKPLEIGTIKKFLDNLLPEGKGLEVFSLFFHITKNNTLALTREIGNETSGALSFFDQDQEIVKTSKRAIKIEELTSRIKVADPMQLIIWDGKPRLSVAGVQDKLPIIYHNGEYSFGEGKLASTHILKFDTQRQRHIVLNEYICMKLAKEVGLEVAEVEIQRFDKIPALLIKRFDRERLSDDEIKRLHIIDGCQALNLPPTHKYERNMGSSKKAKHIREGASFKKLFEFTLLCKNPIKTKLQILQWAFFNLLIQNSDAHGKNISFFVDKNGFELTPFYDMVSIAQYPEFEQDLSMAFGDEFSTDIKLKHIEEFSQSSDIAYKLAIKELKTTAISLLKALETLDFLEIAVDKKEQKFIQNLLSFVKKRAQSFS
jgi:serine/threonine-protein kinase HipA